MTHLCRQVTSVSSPICFVRPKRANSKRRKLRRRSLYCSAEAKEPVAESVRPNPKFSESDVQRICRQGPTFDDLKLYHTSIKTVSVGKTVEELVTYIRTESLVDGIDTPEPCWRQLHRISPMELYQGLLERSWRSPYYNPDSSPWKIVFFEDCGRLFRPSFPGYRALIQEEGKKAAWCYLPLPGKNAYDEDSSVAREPSQLIFLQRQNTPVYPEDYGYLQVFHLLGVAFQQQMPEELENKYQSQGYISPAESESLTTPANRLLDLSFCYTRQEPSMHDVWLTLPLIGLIVFALTFLGVCLAVGIFLPKKQMPSDPIQAMEFAQSKGRARKDGRTGVRFADIAGLDKIIEDLKEIVEFLKEPLKYKEFSAKPPKGLLLEGPPGTGKTLIAKALAGEADVPFYQMSGSEFVEAIVGVGAARVRDLFKRARAQDSACIIFVDEIDALGSKRADAGILTNEEREQTLNQLLTEMDGFSSKSGVIFIAATNRADLLDPALQRPGRFDRKIRVLRPDTDGRLEILQLHANRFTLKKDVNLLQIARDLPGLAGAELENTLNEAALETIRRDGDATTTEDIYNALDRVLEGIRDPIQPGETKLGWLFAVHEMGRAVTATVLRERTGRLEAVEKISIVSRGNKFARTIFHRGKDEDYTMTTRGRMMERISVILAGRAAEQYILGEVTSYSAKDLGPAFRLAQKVVANYGLSDIGITSYAPASSRSAREMRSFEVTVDRIDEDLFGRTIKGGMFQPSDESFHEMLTKCYDVVWEAFNNSLDIIMTYSNAVEIGADMLLANLEVDGEEISMIVAQCPPKPTKKPVPGNVAEICARQIPSQLSIRFELEDDVEEEELSLEKIEETAYPT